MHRSALLSSGLVLTPVTVHRASEAPGGSSRLTRQKPVFTGRINSLSVRNTDEEKKWKKKEREN
jgi:hypothetical protein